MSNIYGSNYFERIILLRSTLVNLLCHSAHVTIGRLSKQRRPWWHRSRPVMISIGRESPSPQPHSEFRKTRRGTGSP